MAEVFICPFCGRNDIYRKCCFTLHVKHCKENPDRVEFVVSEETRKKLSEATRKGMDNPEIKQKLSNCKKKQLENPEYRQKLSKAHKGKKLSDEHKQKISEGNKIGQNRPDVKQRKREDTKKQWENPEYRQKTSESLKIAANRPETRQKEYNTKKQNNSFNTSKIETQLKEYFTSHNINFKTQYKSKEYPFMCDFYFPDKDLYVEIQGCWTHGGRPFDASDIGCINQLALWKSKNKPFYLNAIDTWTNRDVRKRNYAKEHNLNWVEIFSDDFETCITDILKLL